DVAHQDGRGDDDDRPGRTLHAYGQPGDDVGGRPRQGSFRDAAGGGVLVGRVVFGEHPDQDPGHQPYGDGQKDPQASRGKQYGGQQVNTDDGQDGRAEVAVAQSQPGIGSFAGPHKEGADDGRHNTHGRHQQGQHHVSQAESPPHYQ